MSLATHSTSFTTRPCFLWGFTSVHCWRPSL
uniref:Uncharacterized protein n=1 Tax=Timema douglasi TaxID=61478 RepID=A0A7R8W0P6_TIMDO|nr:unnamed protein product [Timema douglasi]